MSNPLVIHARVVTGRGGGPEKTILNSPRFLRQQGFDCLCAYMHPTDDGSGEALQERAAGLDAEFVSIPDRGPLDVRVFKDAISLCRKRRVAIWHGHDYKSNAIGLVARRFWKMKLVSTVHGWVSNENRMPLYSALDKRFLRYVDRVICVSDDLLTEVRRHKIPDDKCCVVYNSIDTDDFSRRQSRVAAKKSLGLPADTTLIGSVGRLAPEKGFHFLIPAFANVLKSKRNLHLCIAGDGDSEQELKSLISKQSLDDHVSLLGHISDPRSLYEALDVYAMSSLREAFPNVLLEAMSYGVPVLSTRVAGTPVLVRDGETGVLVEPGSIGELETGLERLLNFDNRDELGMNGYSLIQNSFRFDARMKRMAEIYRDLLK